MRKHHIFYLILLGFCAAASVFSSCKGEEKPAIEINDTSDEDTPATDDVAPVVEAREPSWTDPIEGLPEDFFLGVDLSSVLVEEKSGVKYYDFDGNEADVFKVFADAGVNYVRLRIWNDPYDENGNGYGGGNNDLATAIELGKRASENGMRVYIDFHYSDFWADPTRQHAPKAWEGMTLDEKSQALYEFTEDSLKQLLDAGVDVGMIQIGNEINYGMAGEYNTDKVITLLKEGSRAIRNVSDEYGRKIDIAIHYTRITAKGAVLDLVSNLVENGVDFDMIGMSYYPFWDGSFDNMKRVLELINERYGKKAFLAETSYAYTLEDGDGNGNNFASTSDIVEGYPATVKGQASIIHDICAAVNEVGGGGIFYWEGAWIPVGPKGANNSPIWEEFGSGWASSFASDYDPEQAGAYYGGCSWDNQAFFDFTGHPLESINVFKYMRGE